MNHELAWTYNLESNGLAKAAVKKMKLLILRFIRAKESIPLAVAAWRNIARDDGSSQNQLFFKGYLCWPPKLPTDLKASMPRTNSASKQ